ncbi:MAG: hypothetical protein JNN30_08660 [Rhodanobacteraceae bacterium]|nr:hypothetical protein [Rhodanobacteraceae bacterium]
MRLCPRTKAFVVQISRSPLPLVICSNAASVGTGSEADFFRRCGSELPIAVRRSSMYFYSGECLPGW